MEKSRRNIHTIDILFPLVFMVLFCFCALLVVLEGSRIYESTAGGLKENYTVRTAITYMQEKLRECSDVSKIELLNVENRQVLAISEDVQGEEYVTYIYLDDGSLKELFMKKDGVPKLSAGQELMPLDSFAVMMEEQDLLKVEVAKDGQEETVYIRIYGNGL